MSFSIWQLGRRQIQLGQPVQYIHGFQYIGEPACVGSCSDSGCSALDLCIVIICIWRCGRFPMSEHVCPRPISPYGVSKLAGENLCILYTVNYGLPTVSLRYFTVFGPRQRPDMAFHKFIRSALENRPLTIYGDGSQTRDFTFVADAVDATYNAGILPGLSGRVLNIGGGSRISLNKVITSH